MKRVPMLEFRLSELKQVDALPRESTLVLPTRRSNSTDIICLATDTLINNCRLATPLKNCCRNARLAPAAGTHEEQRAYWFS